jgi:multimeric flavodoxin WrbA
MKVLAINGSPNKKGNTYHALKNVTDQLETQGTETKFPHLGKSPM